MKKLIAALILLLISVQIQAKSAEAGILLFVNQSSNIEAASDLTLIGLTTSVVGGIVYAVSASPVAGWIGTGGALIFVLDANGPPTQSSLEEALATKYPFLDSQDAVSALASAVRAKLPVQVEKTAMVHLTEVEIRSALTGANLADDELLRVVADLK